MTGQVGELLAYVKAKSDLPPPEMRAAIRRSAGVTLSQIAGALGVTESAVWMWERGQRTPRPKTLLKYGELLQELGRVAGNESPKSGLRVVDCPDLPAGCGGSGEIQPGRDPQHVIVCRRCNGRGEITLLPGEAIGDDD